MAKLAVAAIFLFALLAVAQVSCFRTIVTTTVEEDLNQQGQKEGRCQQQVQQRYQQLHSCRQYLQQSRSPFAMDMYMNQQHQQQLRQCCENLRDLGQCSCDAINQIVREQVQEFGQGQGGGQQGQQGQQKVQQLLQKARNLPRECNLEQECQVQTAYYY